MYEDLFIYSVSEELYFYVLLSGESKLLSMILGFNIGSYEELNFGLQKIYNKSLNYLFSIM